MIRKWPLCDESLLKFCPNEDEKEVRRDLETFICQNGNILTREWTEHPFKRKLQDMVK